MCNLSRYVLFNRLRVVGSSAGAVETGSSGNLLMQNQADLITVLRQRLNKLVTRSMKQGIKE